MRKELENVTRQFILYPDEENIIYTHIYNIMSQAETDPLFLKGVKRGIVVKHTERNLNDLLQKRRNLAKKLKRMGYTLHKLQSLRATSGGKLFKKQLEKNTHITDQNSELLLQLMRYNENAKKAKDEGGENIRQITNANFNQTSRSPTDSYASAKSSLSSYKSAKSSASQGKHSPSRSPSRSWITSGNEQAVIQPRHTFGISFEQYKKTKPANTLEKHQTAAQRRRKALAQQKLLEHEINQKQLELNKERREAEMRRQKRKERQQRQKAAVIAIQAMERGRKVRSRVQHNKKRKEFKENMLAKAKARKNRQREEFLKRRKARNRVAQKKRGRNVSPNESSARKRRKMKRPLYQIGDFVPYHGRVKNVYEKINGTKMVQFNKSTLPALNIKVSPISNKSLPPLRSVM